VTGILAWLHTQAQVALSVLSAIISNQPAPARQVVIYTLVLAALAAATIPRLIKSASK
jgi:hypothetical protein